MIVRMVGKVADEIQTRFAPWRPRMAAAGTMALLLGLLHLTGGFWEMRYGTYRETFGDLHLWGALYTLCGAAMLVPSNVDHRPTWNYRWFMVQSAFACVFSAWLAAMILLTVWDASRMGLTPAGLAYLPLPVYLFMSTVGEVWDGQVARSRERLKRLGIPIPADGG